MVPLEEIEPYITGSYAEGVRSGYESSLKLGQYIYVVKPLSELSRAMILASTSNGGVKVKAVIASDSGFEVEVRDVGTGQVLETDNRFPYKTWEFILTYLDGRWVIEETSVTELE
jgi:hypothetical protein